MSFSRRQILKATGYFAAGIAATNTRKVSQMFSPQIASAAQTPWVEKILNSDGTINWTEYTNVANNYDTSEIIDYRFGPDYTYFHSTQEDIPELWGPTTDGLIGRKIDTGVIDWDGIDWYAMSGQLIFSPNSSAPAEYQPGVARARNGSIYLYKDTTPDYCFDMRVQWTPDRANYYSTIPDVAVTQQSWKKASGGSVPAPPIATVRTKNSTGVTGFLIYKNGFIGATGTGNDGYTGEDSNSSNPTPYPFVKLTPGKIPTAAVITHNNEFLLVTVWDTINRKGQLAVVAIKGDVITSDRKVWHWGFPSWPTIKNMKILGYIDLPFAAPIAIQSSVDHSSGSGRGNGDNHNLDLNSQSERDTWYNRSGSEYKRTAHCGYAVVISRAENKAAFIDLQPLFEYYRKMYFTTQENYDQTKNEGTARNQWPYTFSYVSEQKPKVVSTIKVTKPTAVAAGIPWCTFHWRDSVDTFRENAYIATMDGQMYMYKVGNLMTTEPAGKIGQPFKTVKIGKNPTNIDYGRGADFGNDMLINCRGDKSIYHVYHDGTINSSFRDARLQDPVYVAASHNMRGNPNCPMLTVMDFKGQQVVNYRYQNGEEKPSLNSPFEYGYATSLPGKPFMFTLAEVV